MKFTPKRIEEILLHVVGEEGMPLVHELLAKDNISEFDLATKTKQDIKLVRKMLYILYNHNLVSFTRKKDKQKGWYIYYWTLMPESIRFNYFKMKRDLLEQLNSQLEEERRELFFICSNNCVRLNFDHAMEFEFRCPECGQLLGQDDSREKIKDIEKRIVETAQELEALVEERKAKRKVVKEKRTERKVLKKKAVRERAHKSERIAKPAKKEKPVSRGKSKKSTDKKNKDKSKKKK